MPANIDGFEYQECDPDMSSFPSSTTRPWLNTDDDAESNLVQQLIQEACDWARAKLGDYSETALILRFGRPEGSDLEAGQIVSYLCRIKLNRPNPLDPGNLMWQAELMSAKFVGMVADSEVKHFQFRTFGYQAGGIMVTAWMEMGRFGVVPAMSGIPLPVLILSAQALCGLYQRSLGRR